VSEKKLNRACLVVFSGGQDSTTCLHWALRAFSAVEAVFFDYGQRHKSEILAAQAIAWRVRIPMRIFRLDFFREMKGNALIDHSIPILMPTTGGSLPNTFVPGRNLLFLTQAAAFAYIKGIKDIVTGLCQTDYSGYPDCRMETIRALQKSLHLGLGWPERHGVFRIHVPLMFKTKAESVRLARKWGAMESLAYSHTCYEDAHPPCGQCPACLLRARGFAEAGMMDPLIERTGETHNG
jgi:7-cyano-7-deazaguanine synthase